MAIPSWDNQTIAERLIAEEIRVGNGATVKTPPAFRVCEKLRRSLSTLVGAAGFHSVMARALTIATSEVPGLSEVRVKPDGSLEIPAEIMDQRESVQGGTALVVRLLGLLATFIGEALTLRLVQNIWPKLAFKNSPPGIEKS